MSKIIVGCVIGVCVLAAVLYFLRSRTGSQSGVGAATGGAIRTPLPSEIELDARDLEQVLFALLERAAGAFVIVEQPSSGDFVQFAGSSVEPLLLDLPFAPLSASQTETARSLLTNLSGFTESTVGFNVSFDRDARAAAEMAVSVLREVFGMQPGERLRVQYD